jgi:hypothetical protein
VLSEAASDGDIGAEPAGDERQVVFRIELAVRVYACAGGRYAVSTA